MSTIHSECLDSDPHGRLATADLLLPEVPDDEEEEDDDDDDGEGNGEEDEEEDDTDDGYSE